MLIVLHSTWQKMQFVRAVILFIAFSPFATSSQTHNRNESGSEVPGTSCVNDLETLEKALLRTKKNKIELVRAFYQPRRPPATFVTIHYIFLDEEEHVICNKTWMWSSAVFYLIEPPTVFRFTSLFFATPYTATANITFKSECRDLVTWNENGSCTCKRNSLLGILTQRVSTIKIQLNRPIFDILLLPVTKQKGCSVALKITLLWLVLSWIHPYTPTIEFLRLD